MRRKLTNEELESIFELRDAFVKVYRGFDLYDYQIGPSNEIIRSVLNNEGKTILIEYSRQSGKTEDVGLTVAFLSLCYREICQKYAGFFPTDFNVGIFAPQQEQAKTDFDKVKLIFNNPEILSDYNVRFQEANGNTLRITNGNTVFCFSASLTSNTESKTMHLIILDEAQGIIDSKVENTILPMGANTNATVVYIGTAGYKRCKFHNLLHIGLGENTKFIYDFRQIVKEKYDRFIKTNDDNELNYYRYLKSVLGKIGIQITSPEELIEIDMHRIESDSFKTQYALVWMLEKGQFITAERLRLLEGDYESIDTDKERKCYAGLDFGKMHDSTVLTIGTDSGEIICWLELFGEDYENQFLILLDTLKRYNIRSLCCDSSGTQDQIVDRFRKVMNPVGVNVTGVNFSSSKSDLYKNFDFFLRPVYNENGELLGNARLRYPKTNTPMKEKFIIQMLDLQKQIDDKGKWSCAHPDGESYHDDYCDSVALYCWNFSFYAPLMTNISAPKIMSDIREVQEAAIKAQTGMTWSDKLKYMKKTTGGSVRFT